MASDPRLTSRLQELRRQTVHCPPVLYLRKVSHPIQLHQPRIRQHSGKWHGVGGERLRKVLCSVARQNRQRQLHGEIQRGRVVHAKPRQRHVPNGIGRAQHMAHQLHGLRRGARAQQRHDPLSEPVPTRPDLGRAERERAGLSLRGQGAFADGGAGQNQLTRTARTVVSETQRQPGAAIPRRSEVAAGAIDAWETGAIRSVVVPMRAAQQPTATSCNSGRKRNEETWT